MTTLRIQARASAKPHAVVAAAFASLNRSPHAQAAAGTVTKKAHTTNASFYIGSTSACTAPTGFDIQREHGVSKKLDDTIGKAGIDSKATLGGTCVSGEHAAAKAKVDGGFDGNKAGTLRVQHHRALRGVIDVGSGYKRRARDDR